ncbi:Polyisoprenoid-binding protein YceI [Marivirga sericea]|uniref:Polyisoprenoid-binding protein YceI n=1 Tax=Marivirga sericea TaxID=1028 RepID=A0A1X7L2Y8_9BACT|nr:YceI family protein [Marivirga sericea]SMG48007.1 Polyisoprenoid-binding protein YceI [Marivirga sericea]
MTSKALAIDTSNSAVSFKVKKLLFLTIAGTLTDFSGEITFDSDDLDQAKIDVSVGASTIDTGSSKRDEHLRSKDFFHVNEYPKIKFQSTSIKSHAQAYHAIGKLSMLGVEREVSIPFSFDQGRFKGAFSLNRLDYKLGEKFPAFFIGKNIQISIDCKIKN